MSKFTTYAIAAALLFGAGYGLHVIQTKAATVEQVKTEAKAEVKQAERAANAVTTAAKAQAKSEVQYVYVTKEVEKLVDRPVYLQQCIDDDGLREVNAQILGFAGQPESEVPEP